MYWITNMREAFSRARVTMDTSGALVNKCAHAFMSNAGVHKMGKGWNAHLSFKTAQALKAQGILE